MDRKTFFPKASSLHHDVELWYHGVMKAPGIRTTITLPAIDHQRLRQEALNKKVSFNQLLLMKIGVISTEPEESVAQKIQAAHHFFEKMSRKYGPFDGEKLVREERDQGHE